MRSFLFLRRFFTIGCAVSVLASCKKSPSPKTDDPSSFHIDNSIVDDTNYSTVLYFGQSTANKSDFHVVTSTSKATFRVTTINRNAGSKSITLYKADSTSIFNEEAYTAITDHEGNFWVAGSLVVKSSRRIYIVKLGKDGKVIFSKYFVKSPAPYQENSYRSCALKVLNNSDILYSISSLHGEEVQLMRLKSNGDVIWNKKYTINKGSITNFGGINNLVEDKTGNLYFLSIYTNNNDGTRMQVLTCCTAGGNIKYAKGYNVLYDLTTPNLKLLETGELILYGNGSDMPYLFKLNAENAGIITAKQILIDQRVLRFPYLEDVVQVAQEFKMIFSIENEMDLITLDNGFNIKSTVKVLAKQYGFRNNSIITYDKASNNLFYLFNDVGPAGGSGFQLLGTPVSGASCQIYSKPPQMLSWSNVKPVIKNVYIMVDDDISKEFEMKWNMQTSSYIASDACGQ